MDFPSEPLHQAQIFGLFLITDDYNLAQLLRHSGTDDISRMGLELRYMGFMRAVRQGMHDLGKRRLQAERATYYAGNVRVYCGEKFWHMGPTDPVFAPPQPIPRQGQ